MNMKEGKCVNIQAEIQASAIFHTRDIRGNENGNLCGDVMLVLFIRARCAQT